MSSDLSNSAQTLMRGLKPSSLSEVEVEIVLDSMEEMDPRCGPRPKTAKGKLIAAKTFGSMWQNWDSSLSNPLTTSPTSAPKPGAKRKRWLDEDDSKTL